MKPAQYCCNASVPFEVVRAATPQIISVGDSFRICGTPYGWLHDTNGSPRVFRTLAAAVRALTT